MGIATALIGLLPTYAQIGIMAPVILVLLRLLQGVAAGAELGGAVLMSVEHAPSNRRGLYGSMPGTGIFIGILLSSGVFALFASLPDDQFLSWGWRVPFLLSLVVVAVGLYIRFRIQETPEFVQVKEANAEVRTPVTAVVRGFPKGLLLAMGGTVGHNGNSYVFQTFAIAYVSEQLGLPRSTALIGLLIAAAIGIFTLPAYGALSDRIGRRPVFMGGLVFAAAFGYRFSCCLIPERPF